ncbi:MAG: non-ribosomal peptide synthetase [Acidiferrobacterales bacterium]
MQTRTRILAEEKNLQFPCAPGQRHLWLLHQLNPGDPSLNLSVCWRLEGIVSSAEIERAFRVIMTRHQALRTFFEAVGENVTQIVERHVSFDISVVDLTGLPEAHAQIEVERIARLGASTPFNLLALPLARVTHLRLCNDVSVLLMTVHHIVCDAESMNILARELSEICSASHVRRPPVLPDLPISYGDFSARQAEQATASRQKINADFWERALYAFKYFEIQADRVRPPILTMSGGIESVTLDRELTNDMAHLGGRCGTTLYVVVLSALMTLLHLYSEEKEIAIGAQFVGRDDVGLDSLVGLFSSILVVRADLSDDPGFLALLARIRDDLVEISKHRHIAPEDLIKIVNPERDLSRHPLVSVNFIFRSSFKANSGTCFNLVELPAFSAKTDCDMNFSVIEEPEGWRLSCEYNRNLFESRTIARILNQFKTLLRAVVSDPSAKISSLSALDDIERYELVVEGNCTSEIYPQDLTLPQLFEIQASRVPEAVSVVCGGRSISYRELDIASNRLARELRERGVEANGRVAVFLDRSPEMVVAILAILKSGGAYIPLDPAYPAERLQYVFENSRPAAIVTRASLRDVLMHVSVPVIVIDSDACSIGKQSAAPLVPVAMPADLAYIMYTSGSTGRPKGVAIQHRALVNLLCAMRRRPGLADDDTVVSVTTISFDVAVLDLFLPLVVGAKLVLAKELERADGSALLELLRRHGATFMQATPVTWQLLLEAGWHGNPPLKMLCGGEAMPRKLAERLLKCGGELWNMYGPTETAVWSSALRVETGEGPVPIGPPIANTQFYVLNSHQELAPYGVPGELFIGGDGVALGYFDLPEITNEKFVPDKFRNIPGAKLYRTGDIVRIRQRGCMEYIGRTDHQIKLRGFRIELGEIDAVLLRHPYVAEAVAVLGKDSAGEDAILAYVVADGAYQELPEVLIGALRTGLIQSLPGYMHPASIAILDVLPRTPNGKLDRLSLPTSVPVGQQSRQSAQPLNQTGHRLAKIWSSILGLEVGDETANFFELGGHSLLAARLLSRIEAEFGQRMSLLTLFEAPTIREQAKLLMRSDQREYDFRQVVWLQPNGSKPPLIAIHNTGVYYYNLSRRLGPEQPFMALQLFDPSIAFQNSSQTLVSIAAEYVQLIYKFQATGPYNLIGWCVGGVMAFEVARQLVEAGHEVPLLAMIDAWAPGHNRRLSPLRAVLADYSYRWRLIGADWQKVMSREQTLGMFLAQRTVSKRLLRLLGRSRSDAQASVSFETRELSAENYDQWLLGYLEEVAQGYEPGQYSGKITLLCSAREPKGLFLDPQMGWSAFVSGGIDVAVIDGDHFTVFQRRGLDQMASHISAEIDVYGNSGKRHIASA